MAVFTTLRSAIKARMIEWDGQANAQVSLSFYGNEFAGELGELVTICNTIKKLDREALDLPGSRTTIEKLQKEAADVYICLRRMEVRFGFDLDAAAKKKFNETSFANGLTTLVLE